MVCVPVNRSTRIFISLCVALQSTLAHFAQAETVQKEAISHSDYEACQAQNEAEFRTAIRAITLKALRSGIARLDYKALVRDQWRAHKLENVIDTQVDLAVLQVRNETSWGQLLKSLAYQDKAKELAIAVAERVYRSDATKTALEAMAIDAGREIGKSIELTTTDAKLPAQKCMRAFLGPRYGQTVATAVINDTSAAFTVAPDDAKASTSGVAVAASASGAITGAVILLVRRQLARMAQRLGQRVVGAVLGRLVAIVAGGIGVVLIAKDVWDLRYGVMPIIADEMKSKATKTKVQDELALAIQEQINGQMEVLADGAAEHIIEIWREFKRAHLKILQMSAANRQFKEFVETARTDQLARINEVVAIVIRQGAGEETINRMMTNGSLQRAVIQLPQEGVQIAREIQSVERALSWWDIAGDRMPDVVRLGLHKKAEPESFTRNSLQRILNIDDDVAISRLAAVKARAREVLFEFEDEQLSRLGREMNTQQLDTLAGYMTGLVPDARQEVVRTIVETPSRMNRLDSDYVRQAVIASSDQLAAVKMMLRSDQGLEFDVIRSDFGLAWEQQINPVLLWNKHPLVISAAGFALLFLLLVLRRILFVPRQTRQETI